MAYFYGKTYYPMSNTRCLMHTVINTKSRYMTLDEEHCDDVYNVIASIATGLGCHMLRINGVANHIHMLVDLHSTVALADFMRVVKQRSSLWLKQCGLHPCFRGWGKEYFAHSVSPRHADAVIRYIAGQKEHHRMASFEDEIRRLITNSGMAWDDRMLT